MGFFDSLSLAFHDAINTVACDITASHIDTTARIVPQSIDSTREAEERKTTKSTIGSEDKSFLNDCFTKKQNNPAKEEAKSDDKPVSEEKVEAKEEEKKSDSEEKTEPAKEEAKSEDKPTSEEKVNEEQPVAADGMTGYPFINGGGEPTSVDLCKKINSEYNIAIRNAIKNVSESPRIKPSMDRLNTVSASMEGIENKNIEEINRIINLILDLQKNLDLIAANISFVYKDERNKLYDKLVAMASAYSQNGGIVTEFANNAIAIALGHYDKAMYADLYNIELYRTRLTENLATCDFAKHRMPGIGNHNIDFPKPKKDKMMFEGIIPIESPDSVDYVVTGIDKIPKKTLPDYSDMIAEEEAQESRPILNDNSAIMNESNKDYIQAIDKIANESGVIVTMAPHKKMDGSDSGLISCYVYDITESGIPMLNLHKSFTIDPGLMIDRRVKVFPVVDPDLNVGGFENFNAYGMKRPGNDKGMVFNEKLFRDAFKYEFPVINERDFKEYFRLYTPEFLELNRNVAMITFSNFKDKNIFRNRLLKCNPKFEQAKIDHGDPTLRFRLKDYDQETNTIVLTSEDCPKFYQTPYVPRPVEYIVTITPNKKGNDQITFNRILKSDTQ